MLHGVTRYKAQGHSQVQCQSKRKRSSAEIILSDGLLGVCMDCCIVVIQSGRPVLNGECTASFFICLWLSARLAAPRAMCRVRTAGAPGTAPAGCRGQTSARTPYDTALDPLSHQVTVIWTNRVAGLRCWSFAVVLHNSVVQGGAPAGRDAVGPRGVFSFVWCGGAAASKAGLLGLLG